MTSGPIRALVVDDEPAAREVVTTFLSEVPDVEVVGQARNGTEAVRLVRSERPDLLFLDIQMPGLDGFAVLEELGPDVPPGVVLVTAHGEYAQRAFDVHAVDYVTKPFGRPRFMAAVQRAVHRLAAEEALDMRATLASLVDTLQSDAEHSAGKMEAGSVSADTHTGPRRIGVRLGSRTTLIDTASIDWIEADGDLARLHVGQEHHLIRSTLKELGNTVGTEDFIRVHRSVLVNRARIRVLHRDPDGGGSVSLESGVSLRVARGRWESMEQKLGLSSTG